MKYYRRNILIVAIVCIVLTGGYIWFSYGHKQALKEDSAKFQSQLATTDSDPAPDANDQVATVQVDQPVLLSSVNMPESHWVIGRIRVISRFINPATRLVDVLVELPSSNQFLLDEYVRGEIAIASKVGVVLPRAAVLPEEDHYVLFTIK